MKPYTFIFFGIAGSGKGTQFELLEKYLKDNKLAEEVIYASSGSEYRKLIDNGGYTGQIVKKTLEKGFLQPDFLTTSFFTNVLVSNLTAFTSLVADGYPRTISQSQSFESAMNFYERSDIHIIYIEVGKEEATKRMKLRARADDTDDAISRRFDEYIQNVLPSMKYFEGKEGYNLHTINGEQSVEQVHSDIIKALGI
ncbi:MAG: nucleoside monophosphate kinase [Candidatus Pacebacteria bacterium]|nr:nucleoside monophosphate kinase [Candidatus Paceibacterota bacterium]